MLTSGSRCDAAERKRTSAACTAPRRDACAHRSLSSARVRARARIPPLAQQHTRDCPASQAKIDAVFDKFDADKSGTLVRQCPIAHMAPSVAPPGRAPPPHSRRHRWLQEQSELLPLMKCVCPDVEPDEADVKFMLAEVDMDGNEQIDRNELLPLLAVWKELAQQKETVAPFSPGSESPRGDTLSPLIGGVSLMRPGRSSARIGAPAASEPTAAKSTTCVLL